MKKNFKRTCVVGIGCFAFLGMIINGNAIIVYDCDYSISPTSMAFTSSGGRQAVYIAASGSFCDWTATESLDWISLSSTEGMGSSTLTVKAAANTGKARSGTVTIAAFNFSESLYVFQEAGAFPGRFNPAILPLLLDE
jgi:hypothetical protein